MSSCNGMSWYDEGKCFSSSLTVNSLRAQSMFRGISLYTQFLIQCLLLFLVENKIVVG